MVEGSASDTLGRWSPRGVGSRSGVLGVEELLAVSTQALSLISKGFEEKRRRLHGFIHSAPTVGGR